MPSAHKASHPRSIDPALAGNLVEIASIAFEVGASMVYLVREPQVLWFLDAHGQPLNVGPAGTALVLLFPRRTEGEPTIVGWRAEDVRPPLG